MEKTFPALSIVVNGGIQTVSDIPQHWEQLDGVMIGRAAYHNPFLLADIEHQLFLQPLLDREKVLFDFIPYVEKQLILGVSLQSMTRHILGLFAGQPGGKHWRRYLSEQAREKNAGPEVLLQALAAMSPYATIN